MKKTFKNALIILISIILVSATLPAKKQNIQGKWRMVSGKTNGNPNPEIATDRTWEFKKDNTFEGKIYIQDIQRPFNRGVYMLPNDTTMVTIHSDEKGNLSKIAYTYNYSIKNDSLNLRGFYMANVNGKPGMLQLMFIDEWWVKMK